MLTHRIRTLSNHPCLIRLCFILYLLSHFLPICTRPGTILVELVESFHGPYGFPGGFVVGTSRAFAGISMIGMATVIVLSSTAYRRP